MNFLKIVLGLLMSFVGIAICSYLIYDKDVWSHLTHHFRQSRDAKFQKTSKWANVSHVLNVWWSIVGGLKYVPLNDYEREAFLKYTLNKSKTIVKYGREDFPYILWREGSNHLRAMNCPVTSCIFTSNTSAFKTADALVFGAFRKAQLSIFTPKPKDQIWIAQHREPPYHNRIETKLLNGLINWTASYRRDSTFSFPYFYWLNVNTRRKLPKRNYAQGRKKKVAMFVSNCHDTNGRLAYATELNKSISVDIYGRCGSLKCRNINKTHSCFKMLRDDYKFYLAFENSNCIDYITEKLHNNALGNDVVPIVMGARKEDYAFFTPQGSYIHVDDFESPRHLGEYLNQLDNNDTLYNEYFQYKSHFSKIYVRGRNNVYWCQMCIRLHLADYLHLSSWYDDYNGWWNDACATENDGKNPWKRWKHSS